MDDKNWKQMTENERMDIIDDTNNKLILQEEKRKEDARQRAKQIAGGKCMWSIADLQRFVHVVNSLAKRHGCLDKIPTTTFASRDEFLQAAITILIEHGTTEDEIKMLENINNQVNKSRM